MHASVERVDECLSVRDGHLFMESCDLVDVARRFGTPIYVVSEDQLRRNLESIRAAFAAAWICGPVSVLASLKANTSIALRRVLTLQGAGCDTFGAGELHAALLAGVLPELVSVNGSVKDAAVIERAVACGARITLDSSLELDRVRAAAAAAGVRARIRLRLRPDYDDLLQPSDFFPGMDVRTAAHSYKPGIPSEEAVVVGRDALDAREVEMTGVMAHLGRHSADPDVWAGMARSFANLIGRLSTAWEGWVPREIDIGGGFPAPRDPTAPDGAPARSMIVYAESMATALADELRRCGMDPTGVVLEVEPGRSLYADCGVHLTTVRGRKQQHAPIAWSWVETDTTEMFLADLLIEHAQFAPLVASRAGQAGTDRADIVGLSCGFDVLARQVELPPVQAGDVIAFLDTGAYQDACANNFNALPRPGTVLVCGARAEWIKQPETVAQVFARDVVPERLA